MNHREALRTRAVGRYLNDNLSTREREAFENHYFGCFACAAELKRGGSFAANARAVFRAASIQTDPAFLEKHPYEAVVADAVRGMFSNPEAALATACYEAVCLDLERQRFGRNAPAATYYVRDWRSGERIAERDLNKRGTAEQWIKEGKQAVRMTRLSCHRFRSNEVRLWLSVIAYNLGNLWRRVI